MKMQIPKVSISIITYNQEDFIEEAVRSAADQDYGNVEVVVADDGSTDGTHDILLRLQKEYGEEIIKIIRGNNLGITENSNRALKACSGEFIAFQGGDDVLLPGKIRLQAELMRRNPNCAISYHEAEVFDNYTNDTLYYFSEGQCREGGFEVVLRYGTFFTATTAMVRRACTPKSGFDTRIPKASDWLFWIETLASCQGTIAYLPGVYARHRRHDRNVTNRSSRVDYSEHWLTLDIISEKMGNLPAIKEKSAEISVLEAFENIKCGNYVEALRSLRRSSGVISKIKAALNVYQRSKLLSTKKTKHKARLSLHG